MIDRFQGQYRFLSNFWEHPIPYEGLEYRTSEHAYQAAKTTDLFERTCIQQAHTPGQAKRLGRRITIRPDWDAIKLDVMEEILNIKFADPKLKAMLLATGDQELIEGNTWNDTYWGICNGAGHNHLGRILMKIRGSHA